MKIMNNTYHHMLHSTLSMILSFNYNIPVIDSYHYAVLCNKALNHGIKIVAILDDGIVYEDVIINVTQ